MPADLPFRSGNFVCDAYMQHIAMPNGTPATHSQLFDRSQKHVRAERGLSAEEPAIAPQTGFFGACYVIARNSKPRTTER